MVCNGYTTILCNNILTGSKTTHKPRRPNYIHRIILICDNRRRVVAGKDMNIVSTIIPERLNTICRANSRGCVNLNFKSQLSRCIWIETGDHDCKWLHEAIARDEVHQKLCGSFSQNFTRVCPAFFIPSHGFETGFLSLSPVMGIEEAVCIEISYFKPHFSLPIYL